MSEVAAAATILLLRRAAPGFEVFLVKRHRRSGFMPQMWVFPGGRVEPSDGALPPDRVRGGAHADRFGYSDGRGRAVLVGGVRETWEESGIWLGEGVLPEATRHPLSVGEVALGDLLVAHGGVVDLDRLVPWSRWVTPEGEGRRFDTAFLVAAVDTDAGRHDARETVDSGWFRPRDVLDAGLERMGLAPPTWWTLTELAAFDTLEAVLEAPRDLRPVRPLLDRSATAFGILLPGDPQHPEASRPGLPSRIALGPLGWTTEHA